ncbi:hypothetical protein J2127_001638 [Methanococcus voltae]|nr:hypothetical protein [Methanococcus voltae]MBP2144455.1 hypothetical protein [Methanococcus voltae]
MNHIPKISSKDSFRNMNANDLNNEINNVNSLNSKIVVLSQWWH